MITSPFISAESGGAIQKWPDLRRRYGEEISGESYIMRHLFPIAHKKRADDDIDNDNDNNNNIINNNNDDVDDDITKAIPL